MKHIDILITRYPGLKECKEQIIKAVTVIEEMYKTGNKLLLCGNGGSASDCEHISGELLKGFLLKREVTEDIAIEDNVKKNLQKGIPAIPLTSLSSSLTAFANDVDPSLCFAQLCFALGKNNDVLLGISTSGNSKNVAEAVKVANATGIKTIGLTGQKGGILKELCDICICVPENETFKIQELHLPVYHAICAQAEEDLFI